MPYLILGLSVPPYGFFCLQKASLAFLPLSELYSDWMPLTNSFEKQVGGASLPQLVLQRYPHTLYSL